MASSCHAEQHSSNGDQRGSSHSAWAACPSVTRSASLGISFPSEAPFTTWVMRRNKVIPSVLAWCYLGIGTRRASLGPSLALQSSYPQVVIPPTPWLGWPLSRHSRAASVPCPSRALGGGQWEVIMAGGDELDGSPKPGRSPKMFFFAKIPHAEPILQT